MYTPRYVQFLARLKSGLDIIFNAIFPRQKQCLNAIYQTDIDEEEKVGSFYLFMATPIFSFAYTKEALWAIKLNAYHFSVTHSFINLPQYCRLLSIGNGTDGMLNIQLYQSTLPTTFVKLNHSHLMPLLSIL